MRSYVCMLIVIFWGLLPENVLSVEASLCTKDTQLGVIIIPGITGDLAKRKLLPGLLNLFKKGMRFYLVGTGRNEQTNAHILKQSAPFIASEDQKLFDQFLQFFSYQQLRANERSDFEKLRKAIESPEVQSKNIGSQRTVYLATPSDSFCDYTKMFVDLGIIYRNKDHRIVYEKPFGHSLASALAINKCITRLIDEKQIYRIDHYLAKSILRGVPPLRDNSSIFSHLWNNSSIESIKIIMKEVIDVQGRGSYYDNYGLLKDVIQNHALQLLSLMAIKATDGKTPSEISHKKVSILSHLRVGDGILGQYEGYRNEKDVKPHSRTETYAEVTLWCDLPQWKNVPFKLIAGKALDKKATEIIVTFKYKDNAASTLVFQLAPEEKIVLSFSDIQVSEPLRLGSLPGPFGSQDAYENLLDQILHDDRSSTVTQEEIIEQWKVIEAIEKKAFPLCAYKKNSTGPDKVKKLICFL